MAPKICDQNVLGFIRFIIIIIIIIFVKAFSLRINHNSAYIVKGVWAE